MSEAISIVTEAMRGIVGAVMRESVSYPISISDIRKWAMSVYYPETPPRYYWDEKVDGGIIAPEEFNPFAWMTQKPSPNDPPVSQTAFSEDELGVAPPVYTAILLTEIRVTHSGLRMRPGDVIRSTVRITDYFEREGRMGHMLYTTIADELTNQDGGWIRTNESVFVRY